MHGCNVAQKFVRKRQRRYFKIWDKSEGFNKELWDSWVELLCLDFSCNLWQLVQAEIILAVFQQTDRTQVKTHPEMVPPFLSTLYLQNEPAQRWIWAGDWDFATSPAWWSAQSSTDLIKIFILKWGKRRVLRGILSVALRLSSGRSSTLFSTAVCIGSILLELLLHVTISGVIWVLSVTDQIKAHLQNLSGRRCVKGEVYGQLLSCRITKPLVWGQRNEPGNFHCHPHLAGPMERRTELPSAHNDNSNMDFFSSDQQTEIAI